MTATTAQVIYRAGIGTQLIIRPMDTVEAARAEFGPGLADAKAFVLETCCTECGSAQLETEPCWDCEEPTCGCHADPHDDDHRRCADCAPAPCLCPECDPPGPYDY